MRLLVFLIIMLPATAFAVPVFPSALSGQYTVTIKTPPVAVDSWGLPLVSSIKSVSYDVVEDTAPDVSVAFILCTPVGDDEEAEVTYTVQNNTLGRVAARATSYANDDCTGQSSEMSNTAYHLFNGPSPVQILLAP